MALSDAVKGEYRPALEALRDELAAAVENAKPGEVAALARQLADVLKTLASMAEPEGSQLDELRKRRAERLGSDSSDGTGGRQRSGPGGGRTRAGRRSSA